MSNEVTKLLDQLQEFLQAAEEAKGLGFEVVGYSQRTSEWGEFFLFPKSSMGIVVQFLLATRWSRNYPTEFEFKPPVVHFKVSQCGRCNHFNANDVVLHMKMM